MKFVIGLVLLTLNVYAGTGKIIQADQVSGISVVKNYISNGMIEKNVSGYSTYLDAAGTRPVDGTGGTATHLSVSRTTSSPLAGAGSLLITNSGSTSAQGEGVSVPFTIDSADKAKLLTIRMDYAVNSGTFVSGSEAVDGDLIAYIYDVTNSALIEPVNFKFLASSGEYVGSFQASATATSYRLIFHVASTSTSAWTLKLDNISVGPMQTAANNSPALARMTSSATTAFTNGVAAKTIWDTVTYDKSGGVASTANSRMVIKSAGDYQVDLSMFFSAALSTANGAIQVFAYVNGSNVQTIGSEAIVTGLNTYRYVSASGTLVNLKANDYVEIYIMQDSGATLSSLGALNQFVVSKIASTSQDYAGVVVTAKSKTSTSFTALNTTTYPTSGFSNDFDTLGSMSGGVFTAKVAGYYNLKAFCQATANSYTLLSYRKNGSGGTFFGNGVQTTGPDRFDGTVDLPYLNVGDTIAVGVYSGSSNTTVSYLEFSVTKINTDSTIPAMRNPMTTGGDLIYGGTSGVPTRLANGTAGQVLTSQGTTSAPIWDSIPYTVAAQVSSTGTVTGESANFINGNCTNSGGSATCTFTSLYWATASACQVTLIGDVTGGTLGLISISALSTSSVTIKQSTPGTGNISRDFYLTCSGIRN